MRVPFRLALVTLAVTGAVSALHAHDIAVFPVAGGDGLRLRVKYGHPGDYQSTVAGKLVSLDAYSPGGERRSFAGRLRADDLALLTAPLVEVAAPGTWVFATFYDNGFFLRTDDDRTVNTTRAEYPSAKSATHNLKYGKALAVVGGRSGAGFDRVVGHRLELVPTADPFTIARGGALDVRVIFDGKPLAGAKVFSYPERDTDTPATVTADAAGIARVALDRAGTFIIGSEHGVASRHPDLATRDVYAASLVFSR